MNLNSNTITNNKQTHEAIVIKSYSNSVVVREEDNKYYISNIDRPLIKGDVISFEANYKNDFQKGSFDIFYKSTKSSGYGYANNIKVIKYSKSYRSKLERELIDDESDYSKFTLTMLYKVKIDKNFNLLKKINDLGVIHLFIISGFHISLFFNFTEKISKKFIKDRKIILSISTLIILFFLYLIYFPRTGIRALLTLIILNLKKFNKIESLSIVGIIFFILNPWIMLINSMILSFSITYMIYILDPNYKSFKDMILISFLSFYVSLPTLATWNNHLNITTPLISIVLTPFISFSYIISIVLLPFNNFWFISNSIFIILNLMINILLNLNINLNIKIISTFKQIYLILLTLMYSFVLRKDRWTLLNTSFTLSLLFIII